MTFIGIVSNRIGNKQVNRILSRLENKNYMFIFINNRNVENYKNIKFETVLMDKKLDNKLALQRIVNNAKYIVINSDIKENFDVINNVDAHVITYGFTEKSTVSISSVEDEQIMLSIQRAICKKNGESIETQEICIKQIAGINMHVRIGLSIIEWIYGESI